MRVTCVLNACQTRSERGSDACVIELVAGLYRICSHTLLHNMIATMLGLCDNDKT